MNIQKAIEMLTRYEKDYLVRTEEDFDDAVKLGNEALKRIQMHRRNKPPVSRYPLLDETTEEERR